MTELSALQRRALMGNPWYSHLPQTLRDMIEAHSKIRHLTNNQTLYSRGQQADAWYCILSGAIKVSGSVAEGREVVLTYVEPGNWFGEISLFDGLPRTHDGRAHGATDVLCLPAMHFQQLLQSHPQFCVELMRIQCHRLRLLFAMVEDLHTLSTEQRLARQLLSLARNYGRRETEGLLIDLKLPQDDLAQLLAVTRQSINKILKGWERGGWLIQHYGKITLTNIQALQKEAGTDTLPRAA
jgi:CRP/FNR family transcriptional regulator, cyclic AMP receptor protein